MGTWRDIEASMEGATSEWYELLAREILRLKSIRYQDEVAAAMAAVAKQGVHEAPDGSYRVEDDGDGWVDIHLLDAKMRVRVPLGQVRQLTEEGRP